MDNQQPATIEDVQNLYTDINACFLALMNAIQQKGLLTNTEMREAAQERLLTLTIDAEITAPLITLRQMATALPTDPD